MSRTSSRRLVGGAASIAVALLGMSVPHAAADSVVHDRVVSENPADNTPHVLDGAVNTLVQIGTTMYAGGHFSSVRTVGGATVARANLFAFDVTTGQVLPWAPKTDGEVWSIVAAADGKSVYVGGAYTAIDGAAAKRLARLDAATGKPVAGFSAPAFNASVRDLRLVGTRLIVGGGFTKAGATARVALASLNAATGALDNYLNVGMGGKRGTTPVTVASLDVSRNGRKLVVIGGFNTVKGLSRPQVAVIDLGATAATLSTWSTDRYLPNCSTVYDYTVRDVAISPDSSYFVVNSSGGIRAGTLCDTSVRWDLTSTAAKQAPTWVNYTGGDSLFAVSITGSAIYVAGHHRWLNNNFATNEAGPGAVYRPGIAALDPSNGIPFTWSPTRDRGIRTDGLYPTADGLWIGNDSESIGGERHPRLAFMPLAGERALPANAVGTLPGNVHLIAPRAGATGSAITARPYDGTTAGADTTFPDGGLSWSSTRAAFMIDRTLYTAQSNGELHARPLNGTTYGTLKVVDLRGLTSFGTALSTATGMYWRNGRLYYTKAGSGTLYMRYFTPESRIIGAQEFVVASGTTAMDFTKVQGMFLSGNSLYWASSADGTLHRVNTVNGVPQAGTDTVVSGPAKDRKDWRAKGMFLKP